MSYSGIQEGYKFPERQNLLSRDSGFDRQYNTRAYDSSRDPTIKDYMDAIKFASQKNLGPYHKPASETGNSLAGAPSRIVSRAA